MPAPDKKLFVTAERDGDWAWARTQYETSDRTTYDIAKLVNRSQTAVVQRISREGWVRNKVPQAVEQSAQLLLADRQQQLAERTARLEMVERVNVEMQAKALQTHRKDIAQARGLCGKLFQELEYTMGSLPALYDLGEILRAEDERGRDKLNDAYKRVLSMPERTGTLKQLAETLKVLIALERQAYGISGALEDAEAPATSAQALQGMDTVLAKFSMVLQRAHGPQHSTPADVVENGTA
jgi:hypothetical protein